MLDLKMSFFEQIKAAADRAAAGIAALSRLMANVGDPISTRKRPLMGATQLVLLYGSEVWADALDKKVHRKRLDQMQRLQALRMVSVYRTVSELALMTIARVMPVALLAKVRKAIYRQNLREVVAREERQRTLTEWQLSWQNEPRGRWDGFRQQLYADTGELSPDNILREMMKSAGGWNCIAHYDRALLITKKIELGRRRDRTVRSSLN